eukprot:977414-Rhodomonas_salina.2
MIRGVKPQHSSSVRSRTAFTSAPPWVGPQKAASAPEISLARRLLAYLDQPLHNRHVSVTSRNVERSRATFDGLVRVRARLEERCAGWPFWAALYKGKKEEWLAALTSAPARINSFRMRVYSSTRSLTGPIAVEMYRGVAPGSNINHVSTKHSLEKAKLDNYLSGSAHPYQHPPAGAARHPQQRQGGSLRGEHCLRFVHGGGPGVQYGPPS